MTHPPSPLPTNPAPAPAQVPDAALQQRQQARLARLFRHVGDNADDRYLRELLTRYRGGEPS